MNFFVYDNAENRLSIDEDSVLRVKEFKDLWDITRNKCKEDKTGKLRLRAYKELTYIYLVLDYKSPYFQYLEKDKHESALDDSGLKEEDLKDEKFLAAYRKYQEIQESDPILSLIKTAFKTLHKMQVFLDNIDFNLDVDADGRPLYKPKDVINDIKSISECRTQLKELEIMHKKDLAESGERIRGDAEVGLFDD